MNILINDKIADEAIEMLKNKGHDIDTNKREHDELLRDLKKFDAIIVRSGTKLTEEIIEKASEGKLNAIGRAGIGVDNIDIEKAAEKNIKVVNSPTGATGSVAELAIAHMLALSRNITKADSSMKKGKWIKKQLKGNEIHGKTLGVIGTGNIGTRTAKYAQVFNMKVIGYDPFISAEDMKEKEIEKIEDLKEIMSRSDYISLHVPHNKKTHHIVDEEMISKMKSSAYLINCSRGGTVDEKALYNALKNGDIAGAGIDVYENEPPEKSPLLNLDNVVLTPHLGANTTEGQRRASTICAEQVIKVLEGKKPDFWVNKKFMQ